MFLAGVWGPLLQQMQVRENSFSKVFSKLPLCDGAAFLEVYGSLHFFLHYNNQRAGDYQTLCWERIALCCVVYSLEMFPTLSGPPCHLQCNTRLFLFSVFHTQFWVFGDEHSLNQSLASTAPCPALLLGSWPRSKHDDNMKIFASKNCPKVIKCSLGVLWLPTEAFQDLEALWWVVFSLSLKIERQRYGLSLKIFLKNSDLFFYKHF